MIFFFTQYYGCRCRSLYPGSIVIFNLAWQLRLGGGDDFRCAVLGITEFYLRGLVCGVAYDGLCCDVLGGVLPYLNHRFCTIGVVDLNWEGCLISGLIELLRDYNVPIYRFRSLYGSLSFLLRVGVDVDFVRRGWREVVLGRWLAYFGMSFRESNEN